MHFGNQQKLTPVMKDLCSGNNIAISRQCGATVKVGTSVDPTEGLPNLMESRIIPAFFSSRETRQRPPDRRYLINFYEKGSGRVVVLRRVGGYAGPRP